MGAMLGSFGFHWRSEGPAEQPVRQMVVAGVLDADSRRPELERALALGGAGWRSRMLATVPSNVKNPAWMAEQAVSVADAAGLEVTVWDEHKLAEHGFGGILAVGAASATPPRLVRLDYRPAQGAGKGSGKVPHVVLVGKGITFDTGGLDIKPAQGMSTMKRDMTGGAVVIATMAALAELDCPVRVTGLVPLAENAVGGNAMRPGDVIVHHGGRTSEVNNTDAEGRLVLADAMAYAVSELKPDVLVDVATLTGAMKVALGQRTGGFFANDDALAEAISAAGSASGEPVWRMPLVADYEEKLASKIADADNAAGGAGAITAALFLQHFAGDVPWAHLDVASVGDSPEERYEWTTGPSGFGSRLLLTWLRRPRPGGWAAMRGLTVRWSLAEAPDGVEEALATYVAQTSHARFTGMSGLRFKTWRMRPGEWFEGCYVFVDDQARADFEESFRAGADDSPGSQIVGSSPVLIEACEVVAIAEGWEGFEATPD